MNQITVIEAAKQKKCTGSAIRYAIQDGKIDAEQFGRTWVIRCNRKFDNWQPNPKIQKAGKARWKGVKKTKKAK